MSRNRTAVTDAVAIVGVGVTDYSRDARMTSEALATEACVRAIRDAGLQRDDIDGISGTFTVPAHRVQSALGIREVGWFESAPYPPAPQLIAAMHAVVTGACTVAICYHAAYRFGGQSRQAQGDGIRARAGSGLNVAPATPETLTAATAYAAWTSRHIAEFGTTREQLGLIALNARSHAVDNPHAVARTPMTMRDYLDARPVREPLGMFDMDYPVDGADAFVVTTAERARDMAHAPVLVHATALGQVAPAEPDQLPSLHRTSADVTAEQLWRRSEIQLDAIDLFYPYDGFTLISLMWLESVGFCARGEGGPYLASHWDDRTGQLRLGHGVPMNTHGGSLSEGATQGVGLIREAVVQLRGDAGDRQVADAATALVTPGGFIANASGLILRRG